jgi:GNAT superfamily N-acetyltransferase
MRVTVRRVAPEATYDLRHRVLRLHEAPEDLRLAADDDPRAGFFAAQTDDGTIVGTAAVFPESPPWDADATGAWRLRGMATEERWRSRGIGGDVLEAVVEHVQASGGRLLWCNARLAAVPFYERAGFVRVGEQWDEPFIGPHVAMQRTLGKGPNDPLPAPAGEPI